MITVKCETMKGGTVNLNSDHDVWASYAVAAVGDGPAPEILCTGIKLLDGSSIQFFVNRETGLVVVDHVKKSGKSGVELLRKTIRT